MNYNEIREEVKKVLSEKRFKHSEGVAKRAAELALIYGEDIEKARMIGIAHDVAKEISKEEALQYALENGIEFDEIEKNEPALWHCKIGADIAVKRFGFSDDMKQAILYHTTGNVNMTTLDKIIYMADKTEENRTYEDLKEAIEICNKDLDEGILYCLKRAINYSMLKTSLIHLDTINLINKIIMNKKNSK